MHHRLTATIFWGVTLLAVIAAGATIGSAVTRRGHRPTDAAAAGAARKGRARGAVPGGAADMLATCTAAACGAACARRARRTGT